MALYFSAYTTACLTKQALKHLMEQLLAATEIKVQRMVSSQIGGRMLTEGEAPDQTALEKLLAAYYVNCEGMMRINLDAQKEGIREYRPRCSHPLRAIRIKSDRLPGVLLSEGKIAAQNPLIPPVRGLERLVRPVNQSFFHFPDVLR